MLEKIKTWFNGIVHQQLFRVPYNHCVIVKSCLNSFYQISNATTAHPIVSDNGHIARVIIRERIHKLHTTKRSYI